VPVLKVKGAVLRSRLALVEDLGGAEGMAKVLGSLSGEDRSSLESLLPTNWYPFQIGQRLDDAIVREIGGGRREFFETLGAASAQKNLSGVHKGFLVPGDPHGFLEKAPLIYSFYYDTGRREYLRTGEREGILTTYDATTFSAPDCLTVVGWHRRALEMCGARQPRVVEEECRARGGAFCRYRVSWDAPY
jgi:uncharacterized protein (TIGR02265 family)